MLSDGSRMLRRTLPSWIVVEMSDSEHSRPSLLSKREVGAAAVGSLMMRKTNKPDSFPPSLVACLCAWRQWSGTVTAACRTLLCCASAVSFIFPRTNALIWLREYISPSAVKHASLLRSLMVSSLHVQCTALTCHATSSEPAVFGTTCWELVVHGGFRTQH